MNNKGKIILSVIGVVLSIALLVISTVLAEDKIINNEKSRCIRKKMEE